MREVETSAMPSYLELHKIVTNLSDKAVLEALIAGTFSEFVQKLPDEFHQWAGEIALRYIEEHDRMEAEVKHYYLALRQLSTATNQKERADWINARVPQSLRAGVFILLNGKDLEPWVWKQIKQHGITVTESPDSGTAER